MKYKTDINKVQCWFMKEQSNTTDQPSMRFNTLIDNEKFYTNKFGNPYEIDKSLEHKLHVDKGRTIPSYNSKSSEDNS